MFFWFRRTWTDAVYSFHEGFASMTDETYDEQEWARQKLLRHVSDLDWSDEEVQHQFKVYARAYDPGIRLTRTQKILEKMLQVRSRVGSLM